MNATPINFGFTTFLRLHGVKHMWSAPYHPASNGQAERFVQSLKQALKSQHGWWEKPGPEAVQVFVDLSYLTTLYYWSHSSFNFPEQISVNQFDLLQPSVESWVVEKPASQKACHDCRAKERGWTVGQTVSVISLQPGPDWVPATIVENWVQLHTLLKHEIRIVGKEIQINSKNLNLWMERKRQWSSQEVVTMKLQMYFLTPLVMLGQTWPHLQRRKLQFQLTANHL